MAYAGHFGAVQLMLPARPRDEICRRSQVPILKLADAAQSYGSDAHDPRRAVLPAAALSRKRVDSNDEIHFDSSDEMVTSAIRLLHSTGRRGGGWCAR